MRALGRGPTGGPASAARERLSTVRSWILRHRLRLRLIYGPAHDVQLSEPLPEGAPAPGGAHGRVRRSAQGLVVVPMPPRVGRARHVG